MKREQRNDFPHQKLGFGCMRLPMNEIAGQPAIDHEALCAMVDLFLERGFTYFDTAYTYCGSTCEEALRRALVDRYPRERYTLTDKLPTLLLESRGQQERIFDEQIARCGVEYFDYYLVHCATEAFYEKALQFDSFEFAFRKRAEGRAKRVGFSFHDSPELLEKILSCYPDIDFVQLQISYMDWDRTPIQARRCYEIARRYRKPIVVMCPLKGGMLAAPPAEAERLFRGYRSDRSAASWAIRYAASLPGVIAVLSGMASLDEVRDNTDFMHPFEPLNGEERAIIARATEIIAAVHPVQCTGCRYCEPVCPQRIPIPDYLRYYNREVEAGRADHPGRREAYEVMAEGRGRASDCISCHRCEEHCPQHLSIVDWLRRLAGIFEPAGERLEIR